MLRGLVGKLRARLRQSKRFLVARTVWRVSKPSSILLSLLTVASGLAPTVLRVAIAVLVADAVDGETALASVLVVGAALGLTAVMGAVQLAAGRLLSVRLTHGMQRELMEAVNTPSTIDHFGDRQLLMDLGASQGALGSYFPAQAPMHLSIVGAARIDGIAALVAVAWFGTWWVALALLAAWMLTRTLIRQRVLEAVRSLGGEFTAAQRARYFEQLLTTADAGKELRIFGAAKWFLREFKETWSVALEGTWRALDRLRRVVFALGLVVAAANLVAFLWVVEDARAGDLSPARTILLVLTIPAASALALLGESGVMVEFMLDSFPDGDRILGVDRSQEKAAEGTLSAGRSEDGAPTIEFHNVAFAYPGTDTDVLAALDITFPGGASTAIVGPNGVGKTTIIKLLTQLHEQTAGDIQANGRVLDSTNIDQWRSQIACVFQDFVRLPSSLSANVSCSIPGEVSDTEMAEVLKLVGLSERVDRLPLGTDTPTAPQMDGGVALSGGEWQRVAIARLLLAVRHGASVVILDEPTASLDPGGEKELFDVLLNATRGVTTILTSHRFSTVRRADRIVVLGETGSILEVGSHDELIKTGGHYSEMFQLQAEAFVG